MIIYNPPKSPFKKGGLSFPSFLLNAYALATLTPLGKWDFAPFCKEISLSPPFLLNGYALNMLTPLRKRDFIPPL